jgi:predicted transglutaminase-like cysteine proteinase
MRLLAHVLIATAIVAVAVGLSPSSTTLFGSSRASVPYFGHIELEDPVLPPIGHSRFCLHYPEDCRVRGIDFRRRFIAFTAPRHEELNGVNHRINREIIAMRTPDNGAFEEWLIAPHAGDCNDYAVTKRHELLRQGWPSRALLLSEVVVPTGEHHLILIVRMKDGDMVLDNLHAQILSAVEASRQYQWVRVEMPQNPKFWARARAPGAVHTAMVSK